MLPVTTPSRKNDINLPRDNPKYLEPIEGLYELQINHKNIIKNRDRDFMFMHNDMKGSKEKE